jgi:hypothetical protein
MDYRDRTLFFVRGKQEELESGGIEDSGSRSGPSVYLRL